MNPKTIHYRIFFKQFFVIALFLLVFTQPFFKTFPLISNLDSELVLLDCEDNVEEEKEDLKTEKIKIVIIHSKHSFNTTTNNKAFGLAENALKPVLKEVHIPPPDSI
ncbi:hypothetical protein [Pontimicrobium sp. MEBiC01747]